MVKKITTLILAAAIALTFFGCTVQKPEEKVRTITVTGTGSVSIPASQLTLQFVVKTSEWNVNFAKDKNTTATTKVIDALKASGINENDIYTLNYSITQDNSNNYAGKYTILNYVAVVVRDISVIGNIIDTAIVNGALGLTSYVYSVPDYDKTSLIREVRTLAVQNAQDSASLIAGASGCKILEVLDIAEEVTPDATNTSVVKTITSTPSGKDTYVSQSQDATVTITSKVRITYSLAN